TTIATALKNAINSDTDLQGIGVSATSSGAVLSFVSISSHATSLSKSLSGGATETIALAHKLNVIQAAHNNVNELTRLSGGGAVHLLDTTNNAVKSARITSSPHTLEHAKQSEGDPVLSSGHNSMAVNAVDGGNNSHTEDFNVDVDSASSTTLTYD